MGPPTRGGAAAEGAKLRLLVLRAGVPPFAAALDNFLSGAGGRAVVRHNDGARAAASAVADGEAVLVCHPLGRRSGFQVAARITAAGCDCPVVVLAAAPDAGLRRRASAAGIALCLDPADLSWPLLEQVVHARRLERHLASGLQARSRLVASLSDAVLDLDSKGRVRACSPAVSRPVPAIVIKKLWRLCCQNSPHFG